MASLKLEFSTVRELEKKSSQVFIYGGGAFLVGIVLIFVAAPIGAIITALSAIGVLGAICYVSMLGKERSNALFCPYCASKNDVYVSRRQLNCDICRRPIILSESGEPIIDLPARHDQGDEED